jgi:gliding motility-associated lipoprotein GldH
MLGRIKKLVVLLCFVLTNCDSTAVYDTYKSFPNEWHKDSVASFRFTAPDTTQSYNLFVNLRNNNDYDYNNLYLIVELQYPHGKTLKDTLEYKMAKPNGELLGTGFSDVKENKLWYRGYQDTFRFDEEGDYIVNVQHAMRNNGKVNGIVNLEGVTEVGFRIERVENK